MMIVAIMVITISSCMLMLLMATVDCHSYTSTTTTGTTTTGTTTFSSRPPRSNGLHLLRQLLARQSHGFHEGSSADMGPTDNHDHYDKYGKYGNYDKIKMSTSRHRLGGWVHPTPSTSSSSATPASTTISSGKGAKKNILILISDTGGGHKNSAQAVTEALHVQYPDRFNITTLDIYTQHARYPFNQLSRLYQRLANHPLLWGSLYYATSFQPMKCLQESITSVFCYHDFKSAICHYHADVVVSMHPLCNHIPVRIAKELNACQTRPVSPDIDTRRSPKFVTVVTDLGSAHCSWFDRRVDLCIVPSEEVRAVAKYNGLIDSQIRLRGLPIRSAFLKKYVPLKNILQNDTIIKEYLRDKLGLYQKAKTVLIMSGGDGVGGLPNLVRAILDKLTTQMKGDSTDNNSFCEIIVICGRNKFVCDSLKRAYPKGYVVNNVSVVIKEYVDNVHEFMLASDVLVTKAGPGTIAEAMSSGLPTLLSSYLPGQVNC
jgi:1,2-diacylglycerol 3-beta-galactosyltransferase